MCISSDRVISSRAQVISRGRDVSSRPESLCSRVILSPLRMTRSAQDDSVRYESSHVARHCKARPGAPSACIDEPSHAGPGGLSDLVRLVAASDARVTLLFGRGCIRRDDPSARRVAPTPRHLPYGARSARRTRVAPTCRAAATHRSRSRVRASLTRQTHTSRGVAPTKIVRLIRCY